MRLREATPSWQAVMQEICPPADEVRAELLRDTPDPPYWALLIDYHVPASTQRCSRHDCRRTLGHRVWASHFDALRGAEFCSPACRVIAQNDVLRRAR